MIQGNPFNRSGIGTILCVPLTSNLRLAQAPGNLLLSARATGLPKDSVANVSQLVPVDRRLLRDRVGQLSAAKIALLFQGIDLVLGR